VEDLNELMVSSGDQNYERGVVNELMDSGGIEIVGSNANLIEIMSLGGVEIMS
jgi:hypothetical protein